ncbi:MAG: DUF3267 domain-containing protein [Dethiobacteria bacterium]|nr:DUF3267 domain-containing protein [Dethiobacteria bacterium]
MKYAKRIPPVDEVLKKSLISAGWIQVKEASNLFSAFLFSIPFMLLNAALSIFVMFQLDQTLGRAILELYSFGSWSFTIRFDYIIIIYLLILLHEVIHLVLVPGFASSEKTFFGIKPWGGFVYTTEKISKKRYLLISIAPYVVISLLLPVVLSINGLLNGFIVFLVLINALASSVDMMNAFLLMIQVPGGAEIVSNGFETYYK